MSHEHDNYDGAHAGAAEQGPTVLRVALGSQLRQLREDSGITREAAGEAIRGSHAKISRLELGRTGFKTRDLRDLLALYGVTDSDQLDVYLDMARRANDRGWWRVYADLLPDWFETYIGLEQAATTIRTFEAQFIPGLLQTRDYAQAVIVLGNDQDTARRVEVRMRRQEILARLAPPILWTVLDESALRRPVGGEQVLREQIEHLIRISRRPNVQIQILPFTVGGHAAAGGSFSVLRFREPELHDMVYTEQLTSALYLNKARDVEQYLSVMNKLSVQALDPNRSTEFMTALLDELSGPGAGLRAQQSG